MPAKMYLHVEKRVNGRWTHVPGEFYTGEGNNTAAFAVLAGVRNQMGIKPLRLPRRLPRLGVKTQVSAEVLRAYKAGSISHNEASEKITTWYTFAELFSENWQKFANTWCETDFSEDTIAKLRDISRGENLNDLRIVIWFDDTQADVDFHDNAPYKYTVRS